MKGSDYLGGSELIKIVEQILKERGISKSEFCASIGVSAATYSHWAKGSTPKPERIAEIEKYLGIDLTSIEKSEQLEELRDDLRILLRSAKDLPPSSIYSLIAQIEKEKEKSVLPD